LVISVCGSVIFAQSPRGTAIVVNKQASSWLDCKFDEKLVRLFADRTDLTLVPSAQDSSLQALNSGRFDQEDILKAGLDGHCRYVVWCDILRQDLKIERGFTIPMLLNQRKIKATFEVDYRVLDCYRGKLVASDKITLRRNGPSALQYLDNTDSDPALVMTYEDKLELFESLEQEAASKLYSTFDEVARQH
jgi:hypothetical protein